MTTHFSPPQVIPAIAAAAIAAALALAAPPGAQAARPVPDAEIFATNNTAVITDPENPRLDDRLGGFARTVTRIVRRAGARRAARTARRRVRSSSRCRASRPDALRDGLLADQEAAERLFGGSVTLDGHRILIADLADEAFARAFAESIDGDLCRAVTRRGDRGRRADGAEAHGRHADRRPRRRRAGRLRDQAAGRRAGHVDGGGGHDR